MARNKKKLEKLLEEHLPDNNLEARTIDEAFLKKLKGALIEWGGKELEKYDPVIELAKLANDGTLDDSLRFRCNAEVASYLYPKVRSVEVRKQEDKNINVTVHIAGYAKNQAVSYIAPDEIDSDSEDSEKQPGKDYSDLLLEKLRREKGKYDS